MQNHITNAINCLKKSVVSPLEAVGIPNQVDLDQKIVLTVIIPTFEPDTSYDYQLDKEGRLNKAFSWLKSVQSEKEVDSFIHFYLQNHLSDYSQHFCYRIVSSATLPISYPFACLFEDKGRMYLLPHRASGAQINVYPSQQLSAASIRLDVRLHWTWKRSECRSIDTAPCKISVKAIHEASGAISPSAADVPVPNQVVIDGLLENSDYSITYEITYFDHFTNGEQKLPHAQRTLESKAHVMLRQSHCVNKTRCFYELSKTEISNNEAIRMVRVGAPTVGQVGHKVILIVGGTGSGKSTFINSLANYLYEVDFTHPFRFQLITDRDNAAEAKTIDTSRSQTKKVTAYELSGTRLPYRLTLVDTPGFGDTDGLARDKLTFEYIKKWFEQRDEKGLHTIDAVCTVIKGTEARFNAQLLHEMRSVQALFGFDMKGNMMHVLTFCDTENPPALELLRSENLLASDKTFKLNNRGVMEINSADSELLSLLWKKCQTSLGQFFSTLHEMKPQSTVLTLEVLDRRKALEKQTAILGDQVSTQVTQLQHINSIIEQVRKRSQKTQIKIRRKRWVQTQTTTSTQHLNTWCKNCNFTCHENCGEITDHEISLLNCDVMTNKHPTSAQCTICPKQCLWNSHFAVDFVVTSVEIDEEVGIEQLYAEYGIQSDDRERLNKLMRQLAIEVIEQDKTVGNTLKSIRLRLNELNKIAMRQSYATDSQYIQFLIDAEKQRMRPGDNEERLKVLENHLKIVYLVENSETDMCYVNDTESAAVAYLCKIFPDLYKDLRRNGHFNQAEEEGISPAAVLERVKETNPAEYVNIEKRTKESGWGRQQPKEMLDLMEVDHPAVVDAAKQHLTQRKQGSTTDYQEVSEAVIDAEINDMNSAIDSAVKPSDKSQPGAKPSVFRRFFRRVFRK